MRLRSATACARSARRCRRSASINSFDMRLVAKLVEKGRARWAAHGVKLNKERRRKMKKLMVTMFTAFALAGFGTC